jgi:hypothetical protein
MDIGREKPAIVVEPVEDPFREPTPTEQPREPTEPAPREPAETPA